MFALQYTPDKKLVGGTFSCRHPVEESAEHLSAREVKRALFRSMPENDIQTSKTETAQQDQLVSQTVAGHGDFQAGDENAAVEQRITARQIWGPPPSREQVEAFFAGTEEQARSQFRERWGFDPSSGRPLPAESNQSQWEWQQVGQPEEGPRQERARPKKGHQE